MGIEFNNADDSMNAKIGAIAPDFKLTASDDREIRLSDFRGEKNVVLFFIREFR
jgi:peroxiredoxin